MNESLKQLYNKLILDRQTDPIGFQKRENARQVLDAYNPVCGDHFKLYLDFKGPTITEATYHGYGCALSKASTSVLIEGLKGKSFQESKEFVQFYLRYLEKEDVDAPEIYAALAKAKNFPGRQQCTLLSWEVMLQFFKGNILDIK
jgi:nitrogen fixation NifU-like protein